MNNGIFDREEVQKAFTGLGPDLLAKVQSALSFPYQIKAIKSDAEWATVTNNGNNLWLTVAPNAIYVACKAINKDYKFGRLPNDNKVYKCKDGTIIMGAIQYIEPNQGLAYDIPCAEIGCDNEFLNAFFIKLENTATVLPAISDIANTLGIDKIHVHGWSVDLNSYKATKEKFDYLLQQATEEAYAGNIVKLPESFESIQKTFNWIKSLDLSLVYTLPDNMPEGYSTVADYAKIIIQYLEVAMINAIKAQGNAISSAEENYLQMASWQNAPVADSIAHPQQVDVTAIAQSAVDSMETGIPMTEEAIQIENIPVDLDVNQEVGAIMNSSINAQVVGSITLPNLPLVPNEAPTTENILETSQKVIHESQETLSGIEKAIVQAAETGQPIQFADGSMAQVKVDKSIEVPAENNVLATAQIDPNTGDITMVQPTVQSEPTTLSAEAQAGLDAIYPMGDISSFGRGQIQSITPTEPAKVEMPTTGLAQTESMTIDNSAIENIQPIAVNMGPIPEGYEPIIYKPGQGTKIFTEAPKSIESVESIYTVPNGQQFNVSAPEFPTENVDYSVEVKPVQMPLENLNMQAVEVPQNPVEQINPDCYNTSVVPNVVMPQQQPINANQISIDPETHKVTINQVANEVPVNKEQSNAIPTSPEALAHAANPNMSEVDQLISELEALVNPDAFKETI